MNTPTFQTPYGKSYICDDHYCGSCNGETLEEYGELLGHNRCQQCGDVDAYGPVVHGFLWKMLVDDERLFLCDLCIDKRAWEIRGRTIEPNDLMNVPINHDLYREMMAQQGIPLAC